MIGRTQCVFDVSTSRNLWLRLIPGVEREITLRPDLDGAGFERFFRIEHEVENFVVDLDQA